MSDINNLRSDINDFCHLGVTPTFGVSGLFEFEKMCVALPNQVLVENFNSIMFKSFYFIVASADNIHKNINKSDLPDADKKDLQEKLIYLYSSKVASHAIGILKTMETKNIKHKFVDMLSKAEEKLRKYMIEKGI